MATTADSPICAVLSPRSVRTLYTAMMVLLAKATDRELARIVSYLKEENRNLRACLPEQIKYDNKGTRAVAAFWTAPGEGDLQRGDDRDPLVP